MKNEEDKIVAVNIVASLWISDCKTVFLTKMHLSSTRPKQFEDCFGNLWYSSELTNFEHLK